MFGDRGSQSPGVVAVGARDAGVIQVVSDVPAGIISFAKLVFLAAANARIRGRTPGRVAVDAFQSGTQVNVRAGAEVRAPFLPSGLRVATEADLVARLANNVRLHGSIVVEEPACRR